MIIAGGENMNVKEVNVIVLAYLGDTVYENYIRKHFVCSGISHVKDLQSKVIPFVQAKGQAMFLEKLIDRNFFSDDEIDVIKRARNAKSNSHPKSCDILTYKHATAFEAVIGYLDLINRHDRIEEIIKIILEELGC